MGYAELERAVSAALARGRVRGLYEAMVRGLTGRESAIAEFEDYGSFRRKVREVKERSVEELEELVREFVRNAEARGARVHYAADAEDACNIILRIIEQSGGKKMVKSKSLTSEEIELNDRLEREGIEVLETDLGERIIQQAREKPSHLVFPAMHKTVGDVAELFSAEAGKKLEPEIGALLTYIRSRLRREFLDADVGLNGANVARSRCPRDKRRERKAGGIAPEGPDRPRRDREGGEDGGGGPDAGQVPRRRCYGAEVDRLRLDYGWEDAASGRRRKGAAHCTARQREA